MGKGWTSPAGAKPQNPPSGGSSVKVPAAAAPAQPELPVARELLGQTVIVRTIAAIAGQLEHAAIVTRVHADGAVNVMLLPAAGEIYPIEGVMPFSSGAPLHWRHRR